MVDSLIYLGCMQESKSSINIFMFVQEILYRVLHSESVKYLCMFKQMAQDGRFS